MTQKLMIRAAMKFFFGVILLGGMLFLSAGTFAFFNGWLFLGLLFVPMLMLGVVLLIKSPSLLRKRLDAKEDEKTQKGVVAWTGLCMLVGFIVAGLDFRFGWSHLPPWLVALSSLILLVSYALYGEVMRENAYLSRTIEVQEGQRVVDTGLYKVVRHPMYAVTIWLFLSFPLVLGSFFAFLCFLPYPFILVVRIRNEEKVLSDGLAGYTDYMKRVRYRLIPWVW